MLDFEYAKALAEVVLDTTCSEKESAEFEILRKVPCEDIRTVGGASLAEGIRRLRAGEVIRKPGFDGEYGKIELF